ncbi:hypothetical protein [Microbacterium lacusdiani]
MSWWRRNGLALGALAALIPAAVIVIGGQEWITYYGYRPISPIEVPEGESVEFAGATFGDARLTDATAELTDQIPADAKVVVVEIAVRPGAEPPMCDLTLREASGARHWERASSPSGPLDWDGTDYCPSDSTAPYLIEAPFLLPEDAEGPFVAELVVADELPRFLRLEVGD